MWSWRTLAQNVFQDYKHFMPLIFGKNCYPSLIDGLKEELVVRLRWLIAAILEYAFAQTIWSFSNFSRYTRLSSFGKAKRPRSSKIDVKASTSSSVSSFPSSKNFFSVDSTSDTLPDFNMSNCTLKFWKAITNSIFSSFGRIIQLSIKGPSHVWRSMNKRKEPNIPVEKKIDPSFSSLISIPS